MESLLRFVFRDRDFITVTTNLKKGMSEQLVTGLAGAARFLYVAAWYRILERPVVVVAHNASAAQKAYEDLCELLPAQEVLLYPSHAWTTARTAELTQEEATTLGDRIKVLSCLAGGFSGVLVLPLPLLRKFFLSRQAFSAAHQHLHVGMDAGLGSVQEALLSVGYRRVNRVEQSGDMSVRGGILDLYPPTFAHPLRVEWGEDAIASLRDFDVIGQRSISARKKVRIPPAREYFASPEQCKRAGVQLERMLQEHLSTLRETALRAAYQEGVGRDVVQLQSGRCSASIMYKYLRLIHPDAESLLTYIPDHALFVLDEPARIYENNKQVEKEEAEWQVSSYSQGEMLPSLPIVNRLDEQWNLGKRQRVHLSLFLRQVPGVHSQQAVQVLCRSMQQFHGQIQVLKTEWERWRKANYRIVVVASTQERMQRLMRMLMDYHMVAQVPSERDQPSCFAGDVPLTHIGSLSGGFELSSLRLAVLTESEIFTQRQRRVRRHATSDHAEKIKDYQELKPGDYVVHINHGIGCYQGIETLKVGGVHKDYLHVQYSGNDKLYVPVEQIDQVQKYTGGEEKKPKIYSLGSAEWGRVKNKVQSSVQDIAKDLIHLYSKRQQARGYAFSQDTSLQAEFEAMFPYQETPDQLRSIEEIKRDMEKLQPMDRLLCGDVGYGKTEVAIRAAFKAVMDRKQVAVLVPTTILAQQHYETFRERFSGYPIHIRVLSRFTSHREQREIIHDLAMGRIHIVIGTHRLLSKDIAYADLGLLIIDEEQRFGVKHKEKIKQVQSSIDVLTLSATPIPRTLHMAMMGARDLSVIETPPENRFPVQTYVLEYSEVLVREALDRELSRGGQVYFLYNRVETIDQIAEQLRFLAPNARICVAHGQMAGMELEQTMFDFLDGNYDVLVSTSIIETGVDIPNVNTLIIHSAERMGLSQLYQLRGRVGRSNRIAYAYFTYQRDKVLTEVAEKRLQAIKEFTDLGSGFKIAMRDLSIRGAGNILGAEQHGHITAVGFDLYTKMLRDAVADLKSQGDGQERRLSVATTRIEIQLDVNAYLPLTYINNENQKIECYQRIRAASTVQEIDDVAEEWKDRFGPFPVPVRALIRMAILRTYAIQNGVQSIEQKGEEVTMKLVASWEEGRDKNKLLSVVHSFRGMVRITPPRQFTVVFRGALEPLAWLDHLEAFLVQLGGNRANQQQRGSLSHGFARSTRGGEG